MNVPIVVMVVLWGAVLYMRIRRVPSTVVPRINRRIRNAGKSAAARFRNTTSVHGPMGDWSTPVFT